MSNLPKRLRDLNERFIFQGGSVFAKSLANKLERLESAERECLEQARIVGMGAERELALMAKVDRLLALLGEAREEVEFWTPDESNANDNELEYLNRWYALRDRIDAAREKK